MKFTLAFLLFGLVALSVCLPAPTLNGTSYGENNIISKGEDMVNNIVNKEDEKITAFGEDDDENEDEDEGDEDDEGDDDEDEDDEDEDEDDEDDEDEDDEDDEDDDDEGADDKEEKDSERRKRDIGKIASRYVRDIAQNHANIFSAVQQAIYDLKRR